MTWYWLAILGCSGPDSGGLLDTGWFDKATSLTGGCQDKVVRTEPEAGAVDWYWRDRPTVFTATDRDGRYRGWLLDEDGQQLTTSEVWNGGESTAFELDWDGWLEPNSTYTLFARDCEQTQELSFTTGDFGRPIESSIVGNAYVLDLQNAQWVEPAGLGPLVAFYLEAPILLQVDAVVGDTIKLSGAPGLLMNGEIRQDTSVATWDFGLSDFAEAPFFDAQSELIVLQYSDGGDVVGIPVQGFLFQGTFSADGTQIGGGVLSGRADTREIGRILPPRGDPNSLCEITEGSGIPCVPCEDGESFCLDLLARGVEANLEPSLALVAQAP